MKLVSGRWVSVTEIHQSNTENMRGQMNAEMVAMINELNALVTTQRVA